MSFAKKRKYQIATAILAILAIGSPAYGAPTVVYMESANEQVTLTPFLTAGDLVGSYVVPGIPDGFGAEKLANGKLRLITNHEWSATNSVAAGRNSAGGSSGGSFMSEAIYNIKSGEVEEMSDFIKEIKWFDYSKDEHSNFPKGPFGAAAKDQYGTENHSRLLNRFCSASLTDADLFYDSASGYGYKGAVFLAGEEGGDESRAFAANMKGELVQLPRIGLSSWENLVPADTKSKSTVIMGLEDGSATDSQLWMYRGTKTNSGEWFERAGLNNGTAYVLASETLANDNAFRANIGKNKPTPVTFEKVDWKATGLNQNNQAREVGMELARVEDGHFDPKKPNDFYFVTTESNKDAAATAPNPATPTVSRDGGALWRLRFKDVSNPAKGATLEMLLDGSEAPYLSKPDNLTLDSSGNILIQEDPGNNALVARIVAYNIKNQKVGVVARFKNQYFENGAAQFMTQDEESSGIIDVTDLLRKNSKDTASYYMYVAQIHTTPVKARPDLDPAASWLPLAVEGGQWYVMKVADWRSIYGS